uniref:Uncharacterized protein n=1 Tax=Phlebotomus papatasi TaxID=29031 RepID=A0A1B0D708_PHLPP
VKLHVPLKYHIVHKHHLSRIPVPYPVVKQVPIVKHIPVYKTIQVPVIQKIQVPVPVYIPDYSSHQASGVSSQQIAQDQSLWNGNQYPQWMENNYWDNTDWTDQGQNGHNQLYSLGHQLQDHSVQGHHISQDQGHYHAVPSYQITDHQLNSYPIYDQWKDLYTTTLRRVSNQGFSDHSTYDHSREYLPTAHQINEELPYSTHRVYDHAEEFKPVRSSEYHSQEPLKDSQDSQVQKITDHQAKDQDYSDAQEWKKSRMTVGLDNRGSHKILKHGSQVFDQHVRDHDHQIYPKNHKQTSY